MSEQQVIDQLAEYGHWIETSTGLTLRPAALASDSGDFDELIQAADHEHATKSGFTNGRWVALAAAVALLAGGLSIARLVQSDETLTVAGTQDPQGALHVLPTPESGFEVGNGVADDTDDPAVATASQILIVARAKDDVYRDVVNVRIGGEPPSLPEPWEPIELRSGPARLVERSFLTAISQQRDGVWINVMTGEEQADYLQEILDRVVLDSAGRASFEKQGEIIVLEEIEGWPTGRLYSTSADVPTESSTDPIIVETATSPSPLPGAAFRRGELSPFPVQGVSGWHLSESGPEGEWNGIIWQATPNRIVAVSGHAPLEEVMAVAESLTIVDEATWDEAMGRTPTE